VLRVPTSGAGTRKSPAIRRRTLTTLAHALAVLQLRTDFHNATEAGYFYASRRIVERLEGSLKRHAREIPIDAPEVAKTIDAFYAEALAISPGALKSERCAIRRAFAAVAEIPADVLQQALFVAGKPDPTFADAMVAVRVQDWSDKSRVIETLRRIARHLKRAPEEVPARLCDLDEPILKKLTAADLDVASDDTVPVMRSRARAAIRLVDRTGRRFTLRELEGPWADLHADIRAAVDAKMLDGSVIGELRPLIEFAFRAGLEPRQVDDVAIALWCSRLKQERAYDWKNKVRKAIHRWNKLVGTNAVPSFPRTLLSTVDLSVEPACRPYESLNESCRRSWDAFYVAHRPVASATALIDRLFGDEIEEGQASARGAVEIDIEKILTEDTKDGGRSSRAGGQILATDYLDTLRWYLCQAYTALVAKGRSETALDSVKAVLTYEGFLGAMQAIGRRLAARLESEGKNGAVTPYLVTSAYRLRTIALGAAADPQEIAKIDCKIDQLKEQRTLEPKGRSHIGVRHREMLQQFNSPQNILRWHDRPVNIYREVMGELGALVDGRVVADRANRSRINKNLCAAMEAAVVMLIEQNMPLRRGNVGKTRYKGDRPNLVMPRRVGEDGWLYYSGAETKTGINITTPIDWDTVQVLRAWIEVFLPWKVERQRVDPANVHLFPKFGLGHKNLGGLMRNVQSQYRKVGLDLDLHIHRAIAGKIILTADPDAIELLARLLGHTNAETAKKFYAEEVDPILAQAQWQRILKGEIQRLRSKQLIRAVA
jgi:hypothetical protein